MRKNLKVLKGNAEELGKSCVGHKTNSEQGTDHAHSTKSKATAGSLQLKSLSRFLMTGPISFLNLLDLMGPFLESKPQTDMRSTCNEYIHAFFSYWIQYIAKHYNYFIL